MNNPKLLEYIDWKIKALVDAKAKKTLIPKTLTLTPYDGRVADSESQICYTDCKVSGKTVVLTIDVTYKKAVTSSQTTILSFPSGYSPEKYVSFIATRYSDSKSFIGQITSGNINIINRGGISSGDRLIGQCVWIQK